MIEFIINNKEWLFSGIGVSVLTLILLLIRHAVRRRNNHKVQITTQQSTQHSDNRTHPQEKDSSGYSMHPTPKEIADEINRLPPFQQATADQNYFGLKIRWDVSLFLVHPRDNEEVQLTCTFKGYSRYVNIKASLKKYPEIKIAKEGQIITVYGAIESIDPSGPVVDAHRLEFK